MWSTRPGLLIKPGTATSTWLQAFHEPFCANSTPDLCLTPVSPCMHTQESPAFFSGCLFCCFVVVWFGVAFVVWHFMQETLSKTTQADLCISCINGASTRAKKRHQDSQEGLTPGGLEASAGSPSITAGLVGVAFSMALKKRFRENNTKVGGTWTRHLQQGGTFLLVHGVTGAPFLKVWILGIVSNRWFPKD